MTRSTSPPSEATDAELIGLRETLGQRLALPGEPGFDRARPWNVTIPTRPRAVVNAAGPQDVVQTVRFAAAHDLRVAVQCTGHGAIGIEDDGVLLICTAALDTIELDAQARRARVAAGVTWRQLLDLAGPHGLAAICGSAPGVGVVGLLTGGGVGPLVRTFGLSADFVRAFELVTADGELRHVTAEEHPDLFWAMRGGKSALGIVTMIELELAPLPELTGGAVYFDGADAASVLKRWREWAPGLPEDANTSVALLALPELSDVPPPLAGRLTVAVRFAGTRAPEDYAGLLEPIRRSATPVLDSVQKIPYAEIGSVHADPVDPMPVHEAATMLSELPAEAVDRLVSLAGPGSGSPQSVVELRLLGGALARRGEVPSAFSHREAAYSLLAVGTPTPDTAEQVKEHAGRMIAAFDEHATGGRMPNFAPGAPLRAGEHRYDDATRSRLAELERRYDPTGVLTPGTVTA